MNDYISLMIAFLAGAIGAAINAVAGGGGFITFPSLTFMGISQVNASAISTVALWPGNMASVKALKDDIKINKRTLIYLLLISGSGGLIGAYLLTIVPAKTFEFLAPYLLLISWLMFTFSKSIIKRFNTKIVAHKSFTYSHAKLIPFLLLTIYGGYFGAGLGMMILTLLTFFGMQNLTEMNGLKVMIVAVNNGIAAITFVFMGMIQWPVAIAMLIGAILGGYYGATWTRNLRQDLLRKIIIFIGGAIVLYFFIFK